MDNLLTIAFEAHHPAQNRHRRYQIVVGHDMLDAWTVMICYGRIGSRSQVRRYASADSNSLRAMIRERLLRRLSAPRRIGCSYRLTALSAAPPLDPADWLPNEIMARFIKAD